MPCMTEEILFELSDLREKNVFLETVPDTIAPGDLLKTLLHTGIKYFNSVKNTPYDKTFNGKRKSIQHNHYFFINTS